MPSNPDWDAILRERYPVHKVEKLIFVSSYDLVRSNHDCAQLIYRMIQNNPVVPDELKLIYHEGIFGISEKVRNRVRNRISHIKRQIRYASVILLICFKWIMVALKFLCYMFDKDILRDFCSI